MIRTCESCNQVYDDLNRWTICPHDQFKTNESILRWDRGNALLGKKVVAKASPVKTQFHVFGLESSGMISLVGQAGTFDPYDFEVVGE